MLAKIQRLCKCSGIMKITAKTNWENAKGETITEDFTFLCEDYSTGDIAMEVHWMLTQREGKNFVCGEKNRFNVEVREVNARYSETVRACYNHLAIGALYPSLLCAEKWCAKYYDMEIGGAATEAAFDALLEFGMTSEKIQATAGIGALKAHV